MITITITEYDDNGNLVSATDVSAHVVKTKEDLQRLLDEAVAAKEREDALEKG